MDCFCLACDKLPDNAKNKDHQYRLYGVIVHQGRTIKSGHYMAYVRSFEENVEHGCEYENCCKLNIKRTKSDQNDETVNHSWYLYNDDKVTKVSQTDFDSKFREEAMRKSPYILFYARNDLAA